jgi:predicted porin
MTAGGTAAITLTDGSITYKLGDAAHLSTSEKAVNGPMSGAVDAEARVDSFNGFSVGLGVGPGTLTVALDHNAGAATTTLGDLSTAVACGGQNTGFGLNFAGNVGVDLSFTYGSGSNAISSTNCTGDNASNAASANTMGLAVGMPMGNMSLALDYESSATSNTVGTTETKMAQSGFEISVTMSGIADGTAGINISSQTKTDTVGTADAVDTVEAGTELWWTVPIGPVSLAVGYGSNSKKIGEADPATYTEMGAEMSMSF